MTHSGLLATLLFATLPSADADPGQAKPAQVRLAPRPTVPVAPAPDRLVPANVTATPVLSHNPQTPFVELTPSSAGGCGYLDEETCGAYGPGDGLKAFLLKPEIGFAYVQPRWGKELGGGAEPEGLNYGAVFYPRLELQVNYITETEEVRPFLVSASYLRLEGDLDRQITQTGGSARAEANNELELLVADLVGRKWPAERIGGAPKEKTCWEAVVSIRYASINQRFRSLLTSGTAVASDLSATQSFSGLGISGGAGLQIPLQETRRDEPEPLTLYGKVRGSVLIGNNQKTSTFQVGGVGTVTIQEDERDLIPVGEVEVGLAWGTATVNLLGRYGSGNERPPILGIKVAAIGQVWGDVGYISAARTPAARFESGDLYLYGAMVTFYLEQ